MASDRLVQELILAGGLGFLICGGRGGKHRRSRAHTARRVARAASWPRGPGRYDALVPGRDDIPYYGSGQGDHLDDDDPDDGHLYVRFGRSSDAVVELPPGAVPSSLARVLAAGLDGWVAAWQARQRQRLAKGAGGRKARPARAGTAAGGALLGSQRQETFPGCPWRAETCAQRAEPERGLG